MANASEAVVLLAEDDAAVRVLAAALLRNENFGVIEASNGENALAISREHERIDLLVTDVEMGAGIDGIELAVRMRSERPGIAVLVMSGFPDSANAAAKQNVPFVGKPFTPARLLRSVREALVSRIQPHSETRTAPPQPRAAGSSER